MTADLKTLIARYSDQLTAADTRLLDVVMEDPVRAALGTGKDISGRANVHPAAAVRLARKLGFPGYPEFRDFLRRSLAEDRADFQRPAARIAARLSRNTGRSTLTAIIDSEVAVLERLAASVSEDDIRSAAAAIARARRVFVYGRGHAEALSGLVARRLRRSGHDVVDLADFGEQPAEALLAMGDTDLLWLFVLREPRTRALRYLQAAAACRAATLAVVDLGGGRLKPKPDLQIMAARGSAGESQSLVAPMTVANAIILELAAIDDGRSLRALERYADLRKGFPT